MASIKYRPDVDGLRAVAVLLVIIFHFNKDILPSGFIGVDVFFVISGFIITSAIYPQMKSGTFTFLDFYEKRIKRILPLFYIVAISSLITAYFLFSPNDFSGFADSLRYASVFISNIYFEKNTGYFAPVIRNHATVKHLVAFGGRAILLCMANSPVALFSLSTH
ncbi:acyltransferase [Enterovibrio sp. Hal110]